MHRQQNDSPPPSTPVRSEGSDDEVVVVPIDGVLDLHNYRPAQIGQLVPAYLEACRDQEIFEVRIVHGKGRGALRSSVHALLDRDPTVVRYCPADEGHGGWGATVVTLARDGEL